MTATWSNWTGDQKCRPIAFERPRNVDDITKAVEEAGAQRRTLRVTGAGHSFNDAVVTSGMLMSLDDMNRVLDVDRSTGRVRVQAGIKLRSLNEQLDALGLALENLGDIDVQSIAGATA